MRGRMRLGLLLILLGVIIGVQCQYTLNGKATDNCPFYTTLVGSSCVDNYVKSLDKPILLNEALFRNSFEQSDFDLSGWVKGNLDAQGKYISQCGSKTIYGGFGVIQGNNIVRYISQTFNNLPDHYSLSLKLQFYFIDSWDRELMSIYVDDKVVFTHRFNEQNLPKAELCGQTYAGWAEYVQNITLEVTHTSSTANIKIQWELDQTSTDEAGGVREIQILALGYPTYKLHNLTTNFCPFYTTLDPATKTCVDSYVNSLQAPQILSELFYNRYFTDTSSLEAQGWTRGNVLTDNNYTSTCGDRSYYGGFGALTTTGPKSLTGQFNNLPSHSQIMIKFSFAFIDSWDNELLSVFVDDVQVFSYTHHFNNAGTSPICGGVWNDFRKNFEVPVNHFASTAKIRIQWTVDQPNADESGGIREIEIVLVGNPTYKLNGQTVDNCPFFTTPNLDDKICVDDFVSKARDPQILSQALINKNFGVDSLDATIWKKDNTDAGNKYTTICDGKSIYGGTDAFTQEPKREKAIQATFQNIDLHDQLVIRFNFYFLDSWDDEVLSVFVDGVKVLSKSRHVYNPLNYALCGIPGWKDWVEGITVQIEHISPTAVVRIQWNLDQGSNDESGGLREIQVVALKNPVYKLNGRLVTKCPFYAPLNDQTQSCFDPLVSSLSKPIFINEALTDKKFAGDQLSKSGWSSALSGDQQVSVCDGLSIFGGFNTFTQSPASGNSITGVFKKIKPHNSIVVRFLFYFTDSWDSEFLRVYVDNAKVFEYSHKFQNDGTKPICGNPSFADLIKPFEIEVAHTSRDLTVKIEWTVDQRSDDESGGIREIQVLGKGTIELPTCVTLYTECNFQGEAQSLCDNTPTLDNRVIKSIYLPDDVISLKLFEDVGYTGKSKEFTESQTCLEGIDYKFFAQMEKIKIFKKETTQKIHHLKKNSKSSKN